jgi:Bacterial Ig domain
MRYKWFLSLTTIIVVAIILANYLGLFTSDFSFNNEKPLVDITYPADGATVSKLVMISGTAKNDDEDTSVQSVQIKINGNNWVTTTGTNPWSYDWATYSLPNGNYNISARSYNGKEYSEIVSISILVHNPTVVESDSHKWAIFIAAANFPKQNETKLGNGGLYLAEDMAAFFIEHYQYPTSNIMILFDDGWIRSDNGYGSKQKTLQERPHKYNISYGGATIENVQASFEYIIDQSNAYPDSEVFIWIFDHGVGNSNKSFTGGKILQRSEIFLWDDTITDKELGELLKPLASPKVTIIIDACYSGGFADRTILSFRTSLLLRSGIPGNGRIVISGTSKFRPGYASTLQGPIFSLLWFEGLTTGNADGYRPGLFDRGVQRKLKTFQDGQISVEEAFYYARAVLRSDEQYKDFRTMQPQINDEYPHRGLLRSSGQLIL